MRHVLAASLFLVLTYALLALPAVAGKPTPLPPTATITDHGACSFTVTYEWSGFSGTGLVAELALGYKGTWTENIVIAWTRVPDQAGSGGSVSSTFTLSGAPAAPRAFFGRGNLFKVAKNQPTSLTAVRNAFASSSYLPPLSCGSEVTVS